MKSIIIIVTLIVVMSFTSKAQPISNDTVVCIIDTTKCYVKYRKNPFMNKNPKFHWQVSIQGHYYDIERPQNKDFACIVFDADDLGSIYKNDYKGPFSIKMSKEKINDRFIVETDEWINKQTNMQNLWRSIGFSPSDRYNFIVFKQDFDNVKTDSVTMHRVALGYNEVTEDSFN